MSFNFPASDWRDLQSPLLVDVRLTGMYAASPVAAEVQFDGASAYCARVAVISQACVYAPTPNVVNSCSSVP